MNTRLRLLVLALVVGATLAAIARSDPAAIGRALATMSWQWATVAGVLNLAGIGADAARLRIIVGAVGGIPMSDALEAQFVGIVGNVLFPLKLGEGARAYMLTRRHQHSTATAVTMVVLDRVLDALVLPLFLVVASVMLPLPPSVLRFRDWMLIALAGSSVAGLLAASILRRRHTDGRTPSAIERTFDRVAIGITVLGHRGRLIATIANSLASWAARAVIVWCMLRAFGVELPLSAAIGVLVIVNLGVAMVAMPGNVGTFELATAGALAFWRIPADTALSIGIAMHAVEVLPPLLIGCIVIASGSRVRGCVPYKFPTGS